MHKLRFAASGMILLLALTGCAVVGPDFNGVAAPPFSQNFSSGNSSHSSDTQILGQWWNAFGDPALNALLVRAQSSNNTIAEAFHRVIENRARLGVASANFRPNANANTLYEFRQRSGNAQPFVDDNANAFDLFGVGFDSIWEIDLFGRLARSREAANADLTAAGFEHDELRICVLAEVAAAFIQLRLNQQRIQLAHESLAVQNQTIDLVEERSTSGVSTSLDAAQARAFKYRTEASIRLLEQQVQLNVNLLATLVGGIPHDELQAIIGTGSVPYPTIPGIGIPADLLRRRPDVRRAESAVAAASARIGVATADLYPQLTLLGNVSVSAQTVSNLFTSESLAFSAGPSLTWNILHFGRITYNIEAQKAIMNQTIASYRESVVQAVREVEDGLAQYSGEMGRAQTLQQAIEQDKLAVELALERYKVGRANFQRVLDAQQQLLQDLLNYAQARANTAIQLVATYKAAGGGWENVASTAVNHAPASTPFFPVQPNDTDYRSTNYESTSPGSSTRQSVPPGSGTRENKFELVPEPVEPVEEPLEVIPSPQPTVPDQPGNQTVEEGSASVLIQPADIGGGAFSFDPQSGTRTPTTEINPPWMDPPGTTTPAIAPPVTSPGFGIHAPGISPTRSHTPIRSHDIRPTSGTSQATNATHSTRELFSSSSLLNVAGGQRRRTSSGAGSAAPGSAYVPRTASGSYPLFSR